MTRPDQQRIDDLSAYLDGELPPERRAEIDALLKTSDAARRQLNELRAAADAVADLPRAQAPDALVATMRTHAERSALLGTARKGLPKGVIWLSRLTATAAVIAGCVLVGREAFQSPDDATPGGDVAPLAWDALESEPASRGLRSERSAKQGAPTPATERGTPAPPVARRSGGTLEAAGVPPSGRAISRETARPTYADEIKSGAVAARTGDARGRLAEAGVDARELADSVAAGGGVAAGGALIQVRARDAAEHERLLAVSRRWVALSAGSHEIGRDDESTGDSRSMAPANENTGTAQDTPFIGGNPSPGQVVADVADVQQFAINVSRPALPRLLTALENAAPDQVSVTFQNWSAEAVLGLESSDRQRPSADLRYFASTSAETANGEASEPAAAEESAAAARAERRRAAEPRDAEWANRAEPAEGPATRFGRPWVEEAPAASDATQEPVDYFFDYLADQLAFLGQVALTRPPTVPVQVMIVGPQAPQRGPAGAPAVEALGATSRPAETPEEPGSAENIDPEVDSPPARTDE